MGMWNYQRVASATCPFSRSIPYLGGITQLPSYLLQWGPSVRSSLVYPDMIFLLFAIRSSMFFWTSACPRCTRRIWKAMEIIIQVIWNRPISCGDFARIIHPQSSQKYGLHITKYRRLILSRYPHDTCMICPLYPHFIPVINPCQHHSKPLNPHHIPSCPIPCEWFTQLPMTCIYMYIHTLFIFSYTDN